MLRPAATVLRTVMITGIVIESCQSTALSARRRYYYSGTAIRAMDIIAGPGLGLGLEGGVEWWVVRMREEGVRA